MAIQTRLVFVHILVFEEQVSAAETPKSQVYTLAV